ncbi:MAG: dihydroxyacetone kinase subunit L [Mycoplasmataceae bacterium]|jgi:dihydroxyacetone kinase-like protein|nr:dihydroxyacetone kinase subunit L [Mycoplasmataceae bacterium]
MEITKYMQSIINTLSANESKLNDLDAAIGDGDHGSNILRGFKAVLEQSHNFTKESLIEKDLMLCAQQLMSKIGGSSGPLLGSAFMALSVALKNKTIFTNQDIAQGLQMAFDRISQLGKSKIGEKTMLDAIYPAIKAMDVTQDKLDFTAAARAADDGAIATIPMLATKGRASYLGERSIGHMDPGAYSVALIFSALTKVQADVTDLKITTDNHQTIPANSNDEYKLLPITKLVSILVVSHSESLAKATTQFASEMKNNEFTFEYVAGIENGRFFGTDPQQIKQTIQRLATDSEILIIYDLGSSKMNLEMAISLLPNEYTQRVKVCHCAFVEGTIIAVSTNNTQKASELCDIVESQVKIEK